MCVPQSFALFLLAASSNTQIREPVLTGDGCPLGGNVDDVAKLALFQTREEVFAREEWSLCRSCEMMRP